MYTHIHIHPYVYRNTGMFLDDSRRDCSLIFKSHAYIFIYIYIYIYIHFDAHTYMCIHIYIYTHMYILIQVCFWMIPVGIVASLSNLNNLAKVHPFLEILKSQQYLFPNSNFSCELPFANFQISTISPRCFFPSKFSKVSCIIILRSKSSCSLVATWNLRISNNSRGLDRCFPFSKFSKVSCIVLLHSTSSGELTIENF